MERDENEVKNDDIYEKDKMEINRDNPYVVEKSHSPGERIISVVSLKSIYIALIIFVVLQVGLIVLAIFLLDGLPVVQVLMSLMEFPLFLFFLFVPIKAIIKYNYSQQTITCYKKPIFPISYSCFAKTINFKDISFFYFLKIKSCCKKNYKIGIALKDSDDDIDLIFGQDAKISLEYDNKLYDIPAILKSYLKEY